MSLLGTLGSAGCSLVGIRTEETPKYAVVSEEKTDKGHFEIRQYAPYIVAKTRVKGSYREAQSPAFRILAGYIFGANESSQKMAMTAPVTQSASQSASQAPSESISMTAPVGMKKEGSAGDESWEMTFMMPSKYKMTDLPKPKDSRISFAEVPAKLMAVVRYSGFAGDERNLEEATKLKQWIEATGRFKVLSEPQFAGYDPPWTLPFLRRNEMMFEIEKTSANN